MPPKKKKITQIPPTNTSENTKNAKPIKTFNQPLFCKTEDRETRASIFIKGDIYKGILIKQISTPDIAVADITGNGLNFILISAYLPPTDRKS